MRDTELLERAQAGDAAAFQRLVGPHVESVRRLARSFARSWADADDIAQEALIKAFRSLGSYRADAALSTWLHRITRNAGIDWSRGRQASQRAAEREPEEGIADGAKGQESLVREKQRAEVLWEAIAELDPRLRVALVLFDIEGRSYEEVAEVEGVPVGTVRSRLSRARARLAELLAERDEAVPDSAPALSRTSGEVLSSDTRRAGT